MSTNNQCEQDRRLRELALPLLGKWAPFILILLARQPHSFADLERAIEGISRKVLNENLVQLQMSGLVLKEGQPSTGFPVSYELTKLGISSLVVLESLKSWLIAHEKELIFNQQSFNTK
ncbi:helix-turn-helix domain-containing protein [uncultured Vagococcus sp.]|uniref:winged helix-turn-helix transcriptional regulator n=1 Tax=uncultured Vagococcus sp. TaxID=189676 RepID=UPI0028D42535|nr:helix-turn-helix domain-containing protein [uncultured Vagococcus sp.]